MYRKIYRECAARYGKAAMRRMKKCARQYTREMRRQHPDVQRDAKMLLLPAAGLYAAMSEMGFDAEEALELLCGCGSAMGKRIARFVHAVTCIPGAPELLWKHMPTLMRRTSAPEKGYMRRIVSESETLVGVDILSCPLHDAAVAAGVPQAALVVCAMDLEYMKGFRRIRYTRTKSVAQGAECCDYRLRYDKAKP